MTHGDGKCQIFISGYGIFAQNLRYFGENHTEKRYTIFNQKYFVIIKPNDKFCSANIASNKSVFGQNKRVKMKNFPYRRKPWLRLLSPSLPSLLILFLPRYETIRHFWQILVAYLVYVKTKLGKRLKNRQRKGILLFNNQRN